MVTRDLPGSQKRSQKLRKIDPKEWPFVAGWFEGREGEPIEGMAPLETGFVVEAEDGQLRAVGFLLLTNSKMAWVEFCQTNPALSRADQGLALKALVEGLIGVSRALGFSYIMGLVSEDNFGLTRIYEKLGGIRNPQLKRQIIKII